MEDLTNTLQNLNVIEETDVLKNSIEKIPKNIIYGGIFFEEDFFTNILSLIDNKIIEEFKQISDPHITLFFNGRETTQKMKQVFKWCLENENNKINITITEIIMSKENNLICAKVIFNEEIPCCNENPHITLFLKNDVLPVFSNTVLENENNYSVLLNDLIEIKGTVQLKKRHTKK